MIRFPNPGSTIDHLIDIFQELYLHLEPYEYFTLDNMSAVLALQNLASSSGQVGEDALVQSTRQDRSKDPLYNQSKMYAEIFRQLGWISSSEDASLHYRFTELGKYAAMGANKELLRSSLLGISFPNRAIESKSDVSSRPFAAILDSAVQLGGDICRDEIIYGPFSNNIGGEDLAKSLEDIKSSRPEDDELERLLDDLSARIGIQRNTMSNYTRFPNSALEYSGWFEKKTKRIYRRGKVFFELTKTGEDAWREWKESLDINLQTFDSLPIEAKKAVCQYAFNKTLEEAGFSSKSTKQIISESASVLKKHNIPLALVFSPYQQLSKKEADEYLGITQPIGKPLPKTIVANGSVKKQVVRTVIRNEQAASCQTKENELVKTILKLAEQHMSVEQMVETIFSAHKKSKKEQFYIAVGECFDALGFLCKVSNFGNNNERYDAIILDSKKSIPIEIKSPAEQERISIKAIRQALENKIILLSRGFGEYKTQKDTTSLAVGYYLPEERAEVSELIEAIFAQFGISIAVIGFATLLEMAISTVLNVTSYNRSDIEGAIGYVEI